MEAIAVLDPEADTTCRIFLKVSDTILQHMNKLSPDFVLVLQMSTDLCVRLSEFMTFVTQA